MDTKGSSSGAWSCVNYNVPTFKTNQTPRTRYQEELKRCVVTMSDLSSTENIFKEYLHSAKHPVYNLRDAQAQDLLIEVEYGDNLSCCDSVDDLKGKNMIKSILGVMSLEAPLGKLQIKLELLTQFNNCNGAQGETVEVIC